MLGGDSNTGSCPPRACLRYTTSSHRTRKRMGARTSLRSSCRAASTLMGASLVFNPAFSGRSSPLASPPWKLGWKRAGHAASAKSSLSLILKWRRMWRQSIILSTYLVIFILRIRCLHYKLRIPHWELWSFHTISIRYVQHHHYRWSCWPWTPTRNLRLIYSWQ